MNMMRGIIEKEKAMDDREKANYTYNKLVQKLSKPTRDENEVKKERHIGRKKYFQGKV